MKYKFHRRYPGCVYPVIALHAGEEGVVRECGILTDQTALFIVPPKQDLFFSNTIFGERIPVNVGDVFQKGSFKKLAACSPEDLETIASRTNVPLDELQECFALEKQYRQSL